MAYSTASRSRSTDTERYVRDNWNAGLAGDVVVYGATTPYWISQGKGDRVVTWTNSTTEPTTA